MDVFDYDVLANDEKANRLSSTPPLGYVWE